MIFNHRKNLSVKADFEEQGSFRLRYRLEITRQNPSGSLKTVTAIMQNPSKADEQIADKSVQVLERVVFEKQYPEFVDIDRLIIVNQFAYMQTNDFKGEESQIGHRNDAAITQAILDADIVLVAWGRNNPFQERKATILEIIRENREHRTLLKTSGHPSRVRYKGFILPFELDN